MRVRRHRSTLGLLAALAVALALAPATACWAQGADPQVDPDSPAGTEYELPIDSARERASSGGPRTSGSAGRAPLFGEGVRPPAAGAGTGRASSTTPAPPPATGGPADPERTTPDAVRAQAPAPDSGGGAVAAIAAGGAGVLLLGGLAGLAWRRRSMRRWGP